MNYLQLVGDSISYCDSVGICGPVDGSFDTFSTIDARDDFPFFMATVHIRNASQGELDIAPFFDDDILNFLHGFELIDGPNQKLAVFLFQDPGGEVHVFLRKAIGHSSDGDIEKADFLLVDVDVDFIFQTA